MNPNAAQIKYPTIIAGRIEGVGIRMESLTAGEKIFDFTELNDYRGWDWAAGSFYLDNFGPIPFEGHIYGVTHLQKQSPSGWLKASPSCYHRWNWNHLQERNADGTWIMGTERGWYFRKPTIKIFGAVLIESWRWDVPGTKDEQGILRHWVPTGGYLGGHWD